MRDDAVLGRALPLDRGLAPVKAYITLPVASVDAEHSLLKYGLVLSLLHVSLSTLFKRKLRIYFIIFSWQ